jgi:hypothetical protein
LTWLSWRQQRTETLISAAMLALLAALLVPEAIHLASLYDHDGVARCIGRKGGACRQTLANFGAAAGIARSIGGWFNLVPGLIGTALAAPLLLDLESGTIRLAWTQSVTRRRWIGTKLAVTVTTAFVAAGALSLLFTWYRAPLDKVYGPLDSASFDLEGTVPLGYVLFALALALAVGVLLRRTAPAIVVAFAAYVGSRVFVDYWLRQRFVTPLSATWRNSGPGLQLDRAWILSQGLSDRAGHAFTGGFAVLQSCARVAGKGAKGLDPACMARHGAGYSHVVYQPASRFWELQGIETALFAGVAILLIALASWRLLRAD